MKNFLKWITTIAILPSLVVFVFALVVDAAELSQLTPEQEAEDKTVLYIVKEVNKQIPTDTIITDETIKITGKRIKEIIIKAGYSKKEFSMRTVFCPVGHIHYMATLDSKTQDGQYKLDAKYYFKKQVIKPGIEI